MHPILQVNGLMPVNGIMPQWHLVTHPLELYAISRLCVQIDKQKKDRIKRKGSSRRRAKQLSITNNSGFEP